MPWTAHAECVVSSKINGREAGNSIGEDRQCCGPAGFGLWGMHPASSLLHQRQSDKAFTTRCKEHASCAAEPRSQHQAALSTAAGAQYFSSYASAASLSNCFPPNLYPAVSAVTQLKRGKEVRLPPLPHKTAWLNKSNLPARPACTPSWLIVPVIVLVNVPAPG